MSNPVRPWYLILIPLFFLLFNITAVGIQPTGYLLIIPMLFLLLISFLLFILPEKYNPHRVSLSCLLIFYLFFGHIKSTIPASWFLHSYWVLVPIMLLIPIFLFRILRVNRNHSQTVIQYLNILFLILMPLQAYLSVPRLKIAFGRSNQNLQLSFNKVKKRPDIFLILFDEYPGSLSVQHFFKTPHDALYASLREKGFWVPDSFKSNYDKTVYSLNSILNMHYISTERFKDPVAYDSYLKNYIDIRYNTLITFLKRLGYRIENHSLFGMQGAESSYRFPLLYPSNRQLFSQVFHQRISKDLLWKLYCGPWRTEWAYKRYLLHTHYQNQHILQRTRELAREKHKEPVFVFSHLMMPHEPVFTDSNGHLLDMEFERHLADTTDRYLGYLKYTNRCMLQLVDSLRYAKPDAVIILFSDHGLRDVPANASHLHCDNFMAIRYTGLPVASWQALHSNVNLFRVLLNQLFNQSLSVLPDSSFLVDDTLHTFRQVKSYE